MTEQEELEQLIKDRTDKDYFENKVVLFQRIFEHIKEQVNQQRRAGNNESLTRQLDLANLALKSKANAWAQRSKQQFLSHLAEITAKQKDLSYRDNAYTELYLKHLEEEKRILGY